MTSDLQQFPISVLLPTLNSTKLLAPHIESMMQWIDLVDEIIVVDSDSSDGTVEYLQRELAGFPVKFLTHPRGLYQSWNYGIQQATGQWLYISTVGDPINRNFLSHLRETGRHGRCDVVIGNPSFIDDSNQPLPHFRWAITEIAETIARKQPCVITGAAALYFALRHLYTSALLGSSASNLYRTSHLKSRPFPCDFGPAGDAAWGIKYAFETRFGCTACPGSSFRVHAKSYTPEAQDKSIYDKLADTGFQILAQHGADPETKALDIVRMVSLLHQDMALAAELKTLRRLTRIPWYLRPAVWKKRRLRRRTNQELLHLFSSSVRLIQEKHTEFI